jgi:hypothetical protein
MYVELLNLQYIGIENWKKNQIYSFNKKKVLQLGKY